MSSLLDSLKQQTSPDLIRALASNTDESGDSIQKALQAGSATMLATLASKAQEPAFLSQIMNLISTLSARSAMGAIAGGGSSVVGGPAQVGSRFLKMLFGNNLSGIQNKIAEFSGIRASSAGNILSMAAPMVLDTLASEVNSGGLSASGLGNLLTSELTSLRSFLLAGLSIPDLSSVTPRMPQVAEIVDINVQNPGRNREKVASYSSFVRADLIFIILLVVFGTSAVLLRQQTSDFGGEDVFWADAAQSLLDHGFYGVNGHPETTQPPGLAGILAALFSMFGHSYAVCVRGMAVFEALGFLVAYELLRRRVPRLVAATICIVLLSSPLNFSWATRMVYPCFPYFFTTMVALLSSEEYEKAATARARITWGIVLTAAVAASLLIATGTIALLGAIAAVIVLTALKDRGLARTRLLKLLPVLLVGIAIQGLWMHRKPAPLEWPLPGYPGSYLEQLKLKSGNHPELGMATWSDVPARVMTNLMIESEILVELALPQGIDRRKTAVVIIPVLLIAIGWTYSIGKTLGTEIVDWYFAAYEFMYLLWPWTMERRFFLPIAPLAFFYIWRGIIGIIFCARTRPRVVGIIWFPAALLFAILGAHSIYAHWARGKADLSDELMVPMWVISAGFAVWMASTGQSISAIEAFSRATKWLKEPLRSWRVSPLHLFRYAGYLFVTGVVLMGIRSDIRIARENLNTSDLVNAERTGVVEILAPEIEAGLWLRSHVPPDSVIMARHWPTVRHYAERKLIWFAPISDAGVLLEGIVKHGVDYVVVVKHSEPYYLPDDDYCFDRLLAAHVRAFRLVLERGNLRIFKVEKSATLERGPQSLKCCPSLLPPERPNCSNSGRNA